MPFFFVPISMEPNKFVVIPIEDVTEVKVERSQRTAFTDVGESVVLY